MGGGWIGERGDCRAAGKVGAERERVRRVRRVGVLNDSYKLLPEPPPPPLLLLLYLTPAAGYDSARLLMQRVFLCALMLEKFKVIDLARESSLKSRCS